MYIVLIVLISVALFTYLIILGGSLNKSEEERKLEDYEQVEYLSKVRGKNDEYK